MLEQRKNQRFDLRLPFRVIRAGANSRAAGETRNVSSSGVLFTSAAPIEVGEPIEYCITLLKAAASQGEVKLHCVGKVLRGECDTGFAATLERYEFVRS